MEARKDLARALRVFHRWRKRRRIARGLEKGILAPWWDGLASFLVKHGHAWYTVRRVIEISKPFAAWVEAVGIPVASAITDELIERYLRNGRRTKEGRKCLGLLMMFLRGQSIVPDREPESCPAVAAPPIIREYQKFLQDHRGTSAESAEQHKPHIESLLETLGIRTTKGLRRLTGATLHRFITDRASKLSRSGRKMLCASIRSFLRFLFLRGYTPIDLASAIPVIPSFKLERLPKVIAIEAIDGCRCRITLMG
jgi:hypothetical protein